MGIIASVPLPEVGPIPYTLHTPGNIQNMDYSKLKIVLGMAVFMAVLAIIQADPEPRSHYGYRSRYGQVRGYSGRYQGRNNRGYGKIQPYGSSYKGYGKKRPSVLPMAPMAMPMAPPSPKDTVRSSRRPITLSPPPPIFQAVPAVPTAPAAPVRPSPPPQAPKQEIVFAQQPQEVADVPLAEVPSELPNSLPAFPAVPGQPFDPFV